MLRYWAGARAAAGVTEQSVDAATLAEALDAARSGRGERFAQVLGACSFVVDERPVGLTPHAEVIAGPDAVVEVLPPFAGGALGVTGGVTGVKVVFGRHVCPTMTTSPDHRGGTQVIGCREQGGLGAGMIGA